MVEASNHLIGGNSAMFNDKSILITGGTGSFGRQYVKTILAALPAEESSSSTRATSSSSSRWSRIFNQDCMRYFIGDVRDRDRLVAGDEWRRLRDPRRGAQAGAGGRIQPDGMHQDQHPRRGERHPRRACERRREGHRAVDRQGGQPDQPVRRDQARLRQAVRRGQQSRRRAQDALLGRALRQRRRLARLGGPVLQAADRRAAAIICRSPTRR